MFSEHSCKKYLCPSTTSPFGSGLSWDSRHCSSLSRSLCSTLWASKPAKRIDILSQNWETLEDLTAYKLLLSFYSDASLYEWFGDVFAQKTNNSFVSHVAQRVRHSREHCPTVRCHCLMRRETMTYAIIFDMSLLDISTTPFNPSQIYRSLRWSRFLFCNRHRLTLNVQHNTFILFCWKL